MTDLAPPDTQPPGPLHRRRRDGVEGNARLTASVAVVLFIVLAAEGVTILRIRPLLTPHVFIGMLLVPPVVLKIGSTTWRFVRYYRGSPAYRRKGPPPIVLRLLGPVLITLTLIVFASGIALLLAPTAWRDRMLLLHKVSFFLWIAAMVIHVLGHLLDTARLAPRDWVHRTRQEVSGAGLRQWSIAASLVVGVLLAFITVPEVGRWLVSG
ncbi:MAG TPA: hypothetical protein VGG43_05330 [Acidimicrobiales bacterium]